MSQRKPKKHASIGNQINIKIQNYNPSPIFIYQIYLAIRTTETVPGKRNNFFLKLWPHYFPKYEKQ